MDWRVARMKKFSFWDQLTCHGESSHWVSLWFLKPYETFSGKSTKPSCGVLSVKSSSMFRHSTSDEISSNTSCRHRSIGVEKTWTSWRCYQRASRATTFEWPWKKRTWWLSARKSATRRRAKAWRASPTWTSSFITWRTHWSRLNRILKTTSSNTDSGIRVAENVEMSRRRLQIKLFRLTTFK